MEEKLSTKIINESTTQAVEVPTIRVTEDPVVTDYTEQEIDVQLEWAKRHVEDVNRMVGEAQDKLDLWQSRKDMFLKADPIEIKPIQVNPAQIKNG